MRAQPHAREVRLVNTHYHSAMYSKRLSGKAEGPLMLEGVLDVFIPENNDHIDCWPTAGVWPRDRGALPTHWVYYTETDHLDLPHAGLSTSLMPLKCRWLGASGAYTWASVIWSMPFAHTSIEDFGGGAAGPVMNPWLNANYQHGQGLLSFFYPPDPRGMSTEPTLKLTPSHRLALLRDGLQDNALMEIIKCGKDDAGKPIAVPTTMIDQLQSQLDETFINPTQWRVSRPHHEAWRRGVCSAIAMP